MHESIREAIRRIRYDALKRRWLAEPPPPTCEVCGHSIAYVPIVRAYQGEEDCAACREARAEYQRRHHPGGGGVSVVRIVDAPTREEIEAARGPHKRDLGESSSVRCLEDGEL